MRPYLLTTAMTLWILTHPVSAAELTAEEVAKLPERLKTDSIRVLSDKPLKKEQAQRVLKTIENAYTFDLLQLGWERKGAFGAPLTVAILSTGYMNKHNTFFRGGTFNRALFAMSENFLLNPVYAGVAAHELTHLLVIRNFGDIDGRALGWSALMGEGLANLNGAKFRITTQKSILTDGRVPAKDLDQKMTAADVRKMLSLKGDLAENNPFRYRAGEQFIEFLRVRLNGKGDKNTITKLGSVLATMAKTHAKFEEQFQKQFGTNLDDAHDQFIQFIGKTEGKPHERFAGTVLREKHPGEPDP